MACSVRAANGDPDGCEAAISTEGANHDIMYAKAKVNMNRYGHAYLQAEEET